MSIQTNLVLEMATLLLLVNSACPFRTLNNNRKRTLLDGNALEEDTLLMEFDPLDNMADGERHILDRMRREVSTKEGAHQARENSTKDSTKTTTTENIQSYEDPVDHNFIEVTTKKRVAPKWTEERKKKQAARMRAYWVAQRQKKERLKKEEEEFWEEQRRREEADPNPLDFVYNYDKNDPKNINPVGRNYTGFKPYIEHYTYLPTNATGNNVWYVDY